MLGGVCIGRVSIPGAGTVVLIRVTSAVWASGERSMKAASCRHDSRDGGGDAGDVAVRRRRTIARYGPQLATAAAAAASS